MYSIFRNDGLRKQFAADAKTLVTTQVFSLFPALIVTQLFFHWKSFLLEFVGFLVTWFVIDLLVSLLRATLTGSAKAGPGGP
ncbi:hypothetical protein [Roseibium sp. Sym1]|uniref:hypothetical protein n=1 Tax=Roseibium sp. Sym1 TaxID=3016006 RepID=UPI0022B3E1D0|nr:hypothetical protein [Roseibium sp. Sym1]